jgi:hypothetical protein
LTSTVTRSFIFSTGWFTPQRDRHFRFRHFSQYQYEWIFIMTINPLPVPRIHLIEKGDFPENLVRLDRNTHVWESGFWTLSRNTAEHLVGGWIFLHDAQDKPARFGGEISHFQIPESGVNEGKVSFRFSASKDAVGVRAGKDGWGMEKKIVLE